MFWSYEGETENCGIDADLVSNLVPNQTPETIEHELGLWFGTRLEIVVCGSQFRKSLGSVKSCMKSMKTVNENGDESGLRIKSLPTCPAVARWAEADRPPFSSPLSSTGMDRRTGKGRKAANPLQKHH